MSNDATPAKVRLTDGLGALVERLRAGENFYAESSLWFDAKLAEAVDEAADVIERAIAWQPIETAPRNGALLLLCTDGGIVFVGKMNKHLQLWVCDDGRERFRTVTYWMDLPQPPKAPNAKAHRPA